MAKIHLVGGEKGGVGKSVLSRVLTQYHIDREIPFKAFDADLSHGALMRYYAEFSAVVDLNDYESVDRIVEDAIESEHDIIVDLPAQSAKALERWIGESGLIEFCEEMGLELKFWQVMDDGTDAVKLLDNTLETYGEALDLIVVRNYGRGSDFSVFEASDAKTKAKDQGASFMDLAGLHAGSMRKIDQVGASLWAATNNKDEAVGPTLGMMERQRVRVWLKKVYAELDRVLDLNEEA